MAYLKGYKSGYDTTVNPWATVLNQVNASFERRRAEEQKRKDEEIQLKNLFKELSMRSDFELKQQSSLEDLKNKNQTEQELLKGQIEGKIRPLQNTPVGAIGEAMSPDTMTVSPKSDLGRGIVQQAGLTPAQPNKITSFGRDYEQISQEPKMTATERNYKKKKQIEFSESYSVNNANLKFIEEAMPLLNNLPTGLGGKIKIEWMKNFDPNNQILGDWQRVKSILTDTTLLQSMKTKGAISDKEMEEFKKSAANDDLISISRIKSAFDRYKKILDAENEGKIDGYFKSFGEDPRDGGMEQSQGQSQDDEYNAYLQSIGQ